MDKFTKSLLGNISKSINESVYVDHQTYLRESGNLPMGTAKWTFAERAKLYTKTFEITGLYEDAVKEAKDWAREEKLSQIFVVEGEPSDPFDFEVDSEELDHAEHLYKIWQRAISESNDNGVKIQWQGKNFVITGQVDAGHPKMDRDGNWSLAGVAHDPLKEDAPANATGAEGSDPMSVKTPFKPREFAGAAVFDVDDDKMFASRLGKHPKHRYSRYIGEDEVGQNIRTYAKANPKKSIILRHGKSGAMIYLRRK